MAEPVPTRPGTATTAPAATSRSRGIRTIGAFLFAWGYLYDPISRINSLAQMFVGGVVAGKRVFTILDMEDEKNLVEGERPDALRGDVRFDAVNFSYDKDVPVVKNVSIDVVDPNIDAEEFFSRFVAKRRPCVFNGLPRRLKRATTTRTLQLSCEDFREVAENKVRTSNN